MATRRSHSEIESEEEARKRLKTHASESPGNTISLIDDAYSIQTPFQFVSTKNQSVASNKYIGGVAKRRKSVLVRKKPIPFRMPSRVPPGTQSRTATSSGHDRKTPQSFNKLQQHS